MGATQSKTEPVIFYNQNVPLQFSQGLVDSLETRQKSSQPAPAHTSEEVDNLVRQRVAEELERTHQQQQQLYGDIAKQNIDNDVSSVALGTDIKNMIQRIQRSSPKEIPAEIAERQEALVLCYKKNDARVLDCWQEVEQFKESVTKAQKQFVATHQ
ncbi:uncharacterized protein BX664DRAFT_330408 [Halteromyces radiatus]|uniref:uncharacterized protein n=1 Tax=Halteromyces radiatus TaxID=101107 RepID=UPI00221EE97D|nr:uncharacterized protein BX664DRAFT_330408 [Halteromyces radiatus]KAI8093721.1 hypothetical protein BX664DRAFT_330408 [Halteromyces radiatus]